MNYQLGEIVKHKDYKYETFKVIGIRENETELEGDYSAAYNIIQKDWINNQ